MQQILSSPKEPTLGRFRPGEIVRSESAISPYWQVRFATTIRRMYTDEIRYRYPTWTDRRVAKRASEEAQPYGDADQVRCYCLAVPFGTFPEEIHWFPDDELAPTGLSWKVPTWNELEEWCQRHRETSTSVARLNNPVHWTPEISEDLVYPPYEEEKELTALLATLRPSWKEVVCNKFDAPCPADGRFSSSPAKSDQLTLFA